MNKSKFLKIMRTERECWEALLAQANETQWVLPGVAGDWSIKDIISHVTAYERGLVIWLEAAAQGQAVDFLVNTIINTPRIFRHG